MQKEIFVQVKTLLQIYLCHRSIKLFRRCYNITFANLPVKGTWLHFWNQSHVRFMLNFGVLVSDLECFWEWAGPVLHNYPYQALCNMGLLAIPLMLQSQSYLKSPLTILERRNGWDPSQPFWNTSQPNPNWTCNVKLPSWHFASAQRQMHWSFSICS